MLVYLASLAKLLWNIQNIEYSVYNNVVFSTQFTFKSSIFENLSFILYIFPSILMRQNINSVTISTLHPFRSCPGASFILYDLHEESKMSY